MTARLAYRILGALLLLGALGSSQAAMASDPKAEASKAFETASRAAARGDYSFAAAEFLRANQIIPHPLALYNAALALEAGGERARAADVFADVIAGGGLPEAQSRDARTRLEKLEMHLGVLAISGPSGAVVSVAHARDVAVPVRIHVLPGGYTLKVAFADGVVAERSVRAETAVLDIRLAEPQPKRAIGPSSPAEPSGAVDVQRRDRLPGWIAIGAGVTFAATSAVLGTRALSARDDFNASGHTDADAHDRAASYRTWTNVALGGAILAGGFGAYWLLDK